MLWDTMFGSMGTLGDLNTLGGGHVHINVDAFNFSTAEGEPGL